jgi:AAA family ATP:ADP antiporter
MLQRLLAPLVEVRKEESFTAFLMFAYSFLAMGAYNTIKPLTRSKFIGDLGADNLPYVLLAAGFVIGILMVGYGWLMARLPRRWGLPIVQTGMAGVLLAFWFLFRLHAAWVTVVFFVLVLILGVLLISQFWTLANVVYGPRQAKRLFGFIGGGAPLGGIAGSALAAYAKQIGSVNLILPSAAAMFVCAVLVAAIIARERISAGPAPAGPRKAVPVTEALDLLRGSKHLQIIALVISFAAVGAVIIEQQLNMAAEAAKGAAATDAITVLLAQVGLWTSTIGFVVQVWLTSKVHRYLGIGFALMILPVSLGSTAIVMLLNAALWAPGLARVLDQSLRYSIDKTTREILFLPLPPDIKLKAKSFVDVTVDRGAKAAGALLLLVLVKPWGLHLDWQHLSYASLAVMALWVYTALRARKGYLVAFRQSIERQNLSPADVRLSAADLSTIEALVQELSHPEPSRVVYAIDMLESLGKSSLVTPLLLYHESPAVRERALHALDAAPGELAALWLPHITRMTADANPAVRAAAMAALARISHKDAATFARPLLSDGDPRIRAAAAVALAGSLAPADLDLAEAALTELAADTSDGARAARREAAAAIRQIAEPRFQGLLIPLLYDSAPEVAAEAMESVRAAGSSDFLFVPALISLLRHRQLKAAARSVLVGYGEAAIEPLAHFMRDPDEDIWIRRHIPETLARIPSQKAVDALVAALGEQDGFLRFKAIAALERLRRSGAPLTFPAQTVEAAAIREGQHFFTYLSLYDNLRRGQSPADTLLVRALEQKMDRTKDRIYRLLSLVYPYRDIAAAEWMLNHGDPRGRASAAEYLDNILSAPLRKRIIPIVEDLPIEEKVRRGNVLVRTRPRDVEETLLQLINDDDQVIAAAAIDVVRQQRLWNLGDDVEHVLAHRDVRDWYVFEAASWALAERRMPPDRRRELWIEPLPAAELAERLRHLPLFDAVSVDELFRMAAASRQIRHEGGAVLLQEAAVPDTIHVLLDGNVVAIAQDEAPTIEAPAPVGFLEALQGSPMPCTVRTNGRAITLALTRDELYMLLADNTDLVRGLFATLIDRLDEDAIAGRGLGTPLSSAGVAAPFANVLALQRVPLFSRVSAEEMRRLAEIAHVVPMTAGAPLFPEFEPAALWLVLAGEVVLEDPRGGTPVSARAGDTIGVLSTLAGKPLGRSAAVRTSGSALRIDRDDFFDLLGQRPDLLRQMFSALFGARTVEHAVV